MGRRARRVQPEAAGEESSRGGAGPAQPLPRQRPLRRRRRNSGQPERIGRVFGGPQGLDSIAAILLEV